LEKQAPAEARDKWQALQKSLRKDMPDDRPLWLLATKRLRDLAPEAKSK
jgi:hypothetical protein